MAAEVACPKCGASASPARRSCATCGTSLVRPSRLVPALGAAALLGLAWLGGMLVWAARPLYEDEERYARRVQTAPGTVIQVVRHERKERGRPIYVYVARVAFGGHRTFEAVSWSRLEAGAPVLVYYDPDDPARASLEPPDVGAPVGRLLGYLSGGLLSLVVGLGGLVGIIGRWRQTGRR